MVKMTGQVTVQYLLCSTSALPVRYLFILVLQSGRNRFCFPLSPYVNCTSWPGQMLFSDQRHILRDRRPSTTACPAGWAMGTNELKQCSVGEKIFCTWSTRAAKAEQKSLVPARQAQRTNQGRIPFICTL
jgi:hypothetical protein